MRKKKRDRERRVRHEHITLAINVRQKWDVDSAACRSPCETCVSISPTLSCVIKVATCPQLVVELLGELLGGLGIDLAVVLLAAGHILGLVALQRLDVEDVAERAAVGARHGLDAHVELSAVCGCEWEMLVRCDTTFDNAVTCGVSVTSVVSRLVGLGKVGAHEALSNLCKGSAVR